MKKVSWSHRVKIKNYKMKYMNKGHMLATQLIDVILLKYAVALYIYIYHT